MYTPKSRTSTRPELDNILYSWYLDLIHVAPTYPITKNVLLNQAVYFQKLLDDLVNDNSNDLPISTEANSLSLIWPNKTEEVLFDESELLEEESTISDTKTSQSFSIPCISQYLVRENTTSTVPLQEISTLTDKKIIAHNNSISKPSDSLKGMINHNNRCYMIAVLQQLSSIKSFRDQVLATDLPEGSSSKNLSVLSEFKHLILELYSTRTRTIRISHAFTCRHAKLLFFNH